MLATASSSELDPLSSLSAASLEEDRTRIEGNPFAGLLLALQQQVAAPLQQTVTQPEDPLSVLALQPVAASTSAPAAVVAGDSVVFAGPALALQQPAAPLQQTVPQPEDPLPLLTLQPAMAPTSAPAAGATLVRATVPQPEEPLSVSSPQPVIAPASAPAAGGAGDSVVFVSPALPLQQPAATPLRTTVPQPEGLLRMSRLQPVTAAATAAVAGDLIVLAPPTPIASEPQLLPPQVAQESAPQAAPPPHAGAPGQPARGAPNPKLGGQMPPPAPSTAPASPPVISDQPGTAAVPWQPDAITPAPPWLQVATLLPEGSQPTTRLQGTDLAPRPAAGPPPAAPPVTRENARPTTTAEGPSVSNLAVSAVPARTASLFTLDSPATRSPATQPLLGQPAGSQPLTSSPAELESPTALQLHPQSTPLHLLAASLSTRPAAAPDLPAEPAAPAPLPAPALPADRLMVQPRPLQVAVAPEPGSMSSLAVAAVGAGAQEAHLVEEVQAVDHQTVRPAASERAAAEPVLPPVNLPVAPEVISRVAHHLARVLTEVSSPTLFSEPAQAPDASGEVSPARLPQSEGRDTEALPFPPGNPSQDQPSTMREVAEAREASRPAAALDLLPTSDRPEVHQLSLELSPPRLGHVLLEVQSQGRQISAYLTVDHTQAQQVVSQAGPEVRALLRSQGLEVGAFEVSCRDQGSAQHYQDTTPEPRLWPLPPESSSRPAPSAPWPSPSVVASLGLIDLYA